MPYQLPRSLRVTSFVVRSVALSAVVLAGVWAPSYDAGGDPVTSTSELSGQAQRLIQRHDCSTTGFASETPVSALVRSPGGHLRLVSFDRGWQVFTHHGAATLLALCLDQPPGG